MVGMKHMGFTLFKSKQYLKDEKAYKPEIGKRLTKMEERLEEDPVTETASITRLTDHEPPYRYRIGDFRIFYDVDLLALSVNLAYIKPRSQAYKK